MNPRLLILQRFSTARDFFEKNFYWCIFWGFFVTFIGGFSRLLSNPFLKVFGNILFFGGIAFILTGFCFYVRSYFNK